MRTRDTSGFTLAEVLLASSVLTVVVAAAVLLLGQGLRTHEKTSRTAEGVTAASRLALALQGEVGRCESLLYVDADSTALLLPGGRRVAYATRASGSDLLIYRYLDDGSGFVPKPGRPLGRLRGTDADPARLTFAANGPHALRCRLEAVGLDVELGASRWVDP